MMGAPPGAGYACPMPTGNFKCVSAGADLQMAMRNAQAGDVIVLAPGTYTATATTETVNTNSGSAKVNFQGLGSGTMSQPIVVVGQDPANPPILQGDGPMTGAGYVVHIGGPMPGMADYWVLQNLVVTAGQKGIIFDNSNNSSVCGVEVHATGDEAFHVRDGSTFFTAEGINDHDTGMGQPQYSEAFYVGSFASSDPNFNANVHDVTIKNSVVGPNVPSKLLNFQPGSSNCTADNVSLIGAGGTGVNGGQAFVSNKGQNSVVTNSQFHHANATARTTDVLTELGGSCKDCTTGDTDVQ